MEVLTRTLEGELFGQLARDVHAVLQPGQLRAGNPLSVTAQAGGDSWFSGLALRIHSDDGRNCRGNKQTTKKGE